MDPRKIQFTETELSAKGGHGTISIGTMNDPKLDPTFYVGRQIVLDTESLPSSGEVFKILFEEKLAIKKLNLNLEDAEASAKAFKV